MNATPEHPRLAAQSAALAEITQMRADLIAVHDENVMLKRQMEHQTDRVSLLMEERNTFKRSAEIYRDKLVELATQMSNIGLLTRSADEVMITVKELIHSGNTPEQDQQEQTEAAQLVASFSGHQLLSTPPAAKAAAEKATGK